MSNKINTFVPSVLLCFDSSVVVSLDQNLSSLVSVIVLSYELYLVTKLTTIIIVLIWSHDLYLFDQFLMLTSLYDFLLNKCLP